MRARLKEASRVRFYLSLLLLKEKGKGRQHTHKPRSVETSDVRLLLLKLIRASSTTTRHMQSLIRAKQILEAALSLSDRLSAKRGLHKRKAHQFSGSRRNQLLCHR